MDYPSTIAQERSTKVSPRQSVTVSRSISGVVRAVASDDLTAGSYYEITSVHKDITQAERDTILAHYAAEADGEFLWSYGQLAGHLYDCTYLAPPSVVYVVGGSWTVTCKLSGRRRL